MTLPYTYRVLKEHKRKGVTYQHVAAKDKYDKKRYALERKVFFGFTDVMQAYLKLRPNTKFEDKWNFARIMTYAIPSTPRWAKFMPSGFATHNVHNPENKTLADGHPANILLKRMFRHATDAVGVRSRAYVLSRWVLDWVKLHDSNQVRWMSIAAGSGQPVYDILKQFQPSVLAQTSVTLVEIDPLMLDFARKTFEVYKLKPKSIKYTECDVAKPRLFGELLGKVKPQVIDAMGLFEYLDDEKAIKLIKAIHEQLPSGGMFVFTNMRSDHRYLTFHKRGLGWPGVVPRSATQVLELIEKAEVNLSTVTVATPTDNVYNIYRIGKP